MRRVLAATAAGGLLLVTLGVTGTLALSAPVVAAPAIVPVHAAAATSCRHYPPAKASVTLSSSQVEAGATITVSGSGFLPGSALTVTLEPGGDVLATARASSGGTFSVRVTIPADTAAGNYDVDVSGRGCNGLAVTAHSSLVVVVIMPTTTTSKPLPFTGASVALPVAIGAVLVVVGLAAVVIGRRRPRAAGRG